jgi:hypothetical protein
LRVSRTSPSWARRFGAEQERCAPCR